MSYLQDVIDQTSTYNAGVKRTRASVDNLLAIAAARKAAEAAQALSVAPGSVSHSSGGSGGGSLTALGPGKPVTGMNAQFASALQRMIKDSGGKLSINSGYRSNDRQAQLFAAAVRKYGSEKAARKWVAPPGKSNHNRGTAADIGGDLNWAHANAARYGLVFPMAHEKWHIEPVGARR